MSVIDFARSLFATLVPVAEAHCDTADGPAVTDGRRALASGNLNYALKWIPADGESELRRVFAQARTVRELGPDAAEVADRLFLETLVRIHRAGEGVGFTGIQPSGTEVEPVVLAADRALETGDDSQLRPLVADDRWPELHRRFGEALALRDFDVDDLAAGREYLEAYVHFFKYAEGEDHDHGHACGGHAPADAHDPHAEHAHGAHLLEAHAHHAHAH